MYITCIFVCVCVCMYVCVHVCILCVCVCGLKTPGRTLTEVHALSNCKRQVTRVGCDVADVEAITRMTNPPHAFLLGVSTPTENGSSDAEVCKKAKKFWFVNPVGGGAHSQK